MDINGIKSRGKLSQNQKNYYPLDWNFLFKLQSREFQCSYCGKFFDQRYITEDHIYPKSLGGQIKTTSCNECNKLKGSMLPIEWALFAYQNNIDIGLGEIIINKNPKKHRIKRS